MWMTYDKAATKGCEHPRAIVEACAIKDLFSAKHYAPGYNLKFQIIAFAAVVAAALARSPPLILPAQPDYNQVVLVKETPLDNIGIDGYQFGYELSNGQAHQETAQLVNAGQENESLAVRGSFTYVDPATNVRYTVNYVADENGFRPEGAHLPSA
ncbi:flexible cuticle protein 12-like isoform X1 [Nylanderia fulva]|uniref:flexible cuticle protein 12-like isoform X1 n=1 Tax=Nylanderia fulva TaxID=613905 RepID=UPI0010FB9801|nr:flexible cuticle protein 12-like isoform X1 [Nylanderia fulva]